MSDRDVGQSGSPSGARAATVSDIHELMRRKEEIEAQIKANYDVLEGQKGVGMNEPLVDLEGYPRADVDLYQVRTARHNIIYHCDELGHRFISWSLITSAKFHLPWKVTCSQTSEMQTGASLGTFFTLPLLGNPQSLP